MVLKNKRAIGSAVQTVYLLLTILVGGYRHQFTINRPFAVGVPVTSGFEIHHVGVQLGAIL